MAPASNPFLESFSEFVAKIAPLGVWNSLVQTVLKLTVPGVPDIYQGAELWDFSLVDPDNRRPVDFEWRRQMLEGRGRGSDQAWDLKALTENWQTGAIKLRLITDLLSLRQEHPGLFQVGSYESVCAEGPAANRVCAFVRTHNGSSLLVSTLLYPSLGMEGTPQTKIRLPDGMGNLPWTSIFEFAHAADVQQRRPHCNQCLPRRSC